MRRIAVLVLGLAGSAGADPKSAPAKRAPSPAVEVEPWVPPARATDKVPGMNGAMASGIVIAPEGGADARPWPYGIWIRTPDVGDRNVIVPGTNDLPDGESSALSARLSRGL